MLDSNDTSKIDNEQIPTFQPMRLGDLLDTTLSLYRRNLRLFLGIASIYFVLMALHQGVIVLLLERPSPPIRANVISDVDSVLSTFAYMLVVGVLVVASSEIYLGRHVTIHIALRHFSSCFLAYTGATLIYLILYLISTLNSLDSIQISRGSLLILFSLPFLFYFLIRWVFYGPIILIEKATTSRSLVRSKALAQGSGGRVLGIVLAILLLDTAMYYILGNSLGIVFALLGVVQNGSLTETIGDLLSLKYEDIRPTSLDSLIMCIVYLGAEAFTLPIYGIGITLLYYDLRIRKEGFDIEMRVRNAEALDVVNEM